MRKDKEEKTLSKQETKQVTKKRCLRDQALERMREKGHEQKLENCKKEQARVRKN